MFAVSGKEYLWIGFRQYSVKAVREQLEEEKWVEISTGDGTKGEKRFQWQSVEVNCADSQHKKYLIFRRSLSDETEIRAYIAYGSMETKLAEFIKTAGIRWTIEMNFAEMKGETGLDQYEVRSYDGWYKHITLSCLAHTFLTVLREQFQEIPDMTAESETNMDTFKKRKKIRITISKTEIRRIIADFVYPAYSDFSFRIKSIKWKLRHQLNASVCHWKYHFLQL